MLSFFKKPLKHILMTGGSVGGRTTLLYHNIIHHTEIGKSRLVLPTIGCNREELPYNKIKFVFWDYGTSILNVRTLLKNVYPITNGVMFLIDSTFTSKEEKEDSIKLVEELFEGIDLRQYVPKGKLDDVSEALLLSVYGFKKYDDYNNKET